MNKKTIAILLSCITLVSAIVLICGISIPPRTVIQTYPPVAETIPEQVGNLAAPAPSDGEAESIVPENDAVVTEYCEFSNHKFGEPVYEADPKVFNVYYKEEVCSVCGFVCKTAWSLYLPESVNTIPEPGSEKDILLYYVYCSDGSHVVDFGD